MTEVTEVTSEQPAAAAEGAEKKEGEGEEPKEEEPKPKEPEKKKEPEPKPKVEKPPPDYRTVKAGWIEKPGKNISLSPSLPLSLSISLPYLHFVCVYRCDLQEFQASLHDPG